MENEILLIDKPAGISSFGVVARVRRVLSEQAGKKVKVGHTGTLDPFATGLLILLTGKMTKKSNEFLKLDKTYEATLKLGYTSTTGDPEGVITASEITADACSSPSLRVERRSLRSPLVAQAALDFDAVMQTLNAVVGEIEQQVPKFSAVKINGQRAYKLARDGKDFETPTRKVTIYSIEILEYNYPELKIRTHVSSGTYIRTLAEDIGKKLGTGAYLTSLRRITVGNYKVENAVKLDTIITKEEK